MMKFFGLKNCDTCKKAQRWLQDHNVEFAYHDVRADGLTEAFVANVLQAVPLDKVVNKRSTTWRSLSEEQKSGLTIANAPALLVANPTLMKRPVISTHQPEQPFIVGFSAAEYEATVL